MHWKAPLPLMARPSGPPRLFEPIVDETINNAATYEFGWDKDYRAVLVTLMAIVPVGAADSLRLRTSGDGGSTFDSGASDYRLERVAADTNMTFDQAVSVDRLGLVEGATPLSNAADRGLNGDLIVAQPFDAKPTQLYGRVGYWGSGGPIMVNGLVYGQRNAAGRVDALQLFMEASNISTGRVRAIGILPHGEA